MTSPTLLVSDSIPMTVVEEEPRKTDMPPPMKRKAMDEDQEPKSPAGDGVALKSAIQWDSTLEECVYYLRWGANGDALLRRWNKKMKKNNKVHIPANVWRALVTEKDQYLDTIATAVKTYNDTDLEIQSTVLLHLANDWVLRLHTYNDKLYVGLLRADPTDPDLILAGVGMNFYPEDYQGLLDKLVERAAAEDKASPRRKKRKPEAGVQGVFRFTRVHWTATLRTLPEGEILQKSSFRCRQALCGLLEMVDGLKTVPTLDVTTTPYENFHLKGVPHQFEVAPDLLRALYCKIVDGHCHTHKMEGEWHNTLGEGSKVPDTTPMDWTTDAGRIKAAQDISHSELMSNLLEVVNPSARKTFELDNMRDTLMMAKELLRFKGDPTLREKDQDATCMELVRNHFPAYYR